VMTQGGIRSARMRGISASPRKMLLLAPSLEATTDLFTDVTLSRGRHTDLIAEMQEVRGRIYLEEGAITEAELSDGRHRQPSDDRSWHLLILENDLVCGCARYREHSIGVGYPDLSVSKSALAKSPVFGSRLRSSVEAELALARRMKLPFVELGGWALTQEIRATAEALRMALASYALARGLGGGVGISTVTCRNGSSTILRRMGGRSLQERGEDLPPYYDPQFRCEMEVLRFYSWAPNPRYKLWIDATVAELSAIPVIANHPTL
jgi:hypothetical protein